MANSPLLTDYKRSSFLPPTYECRPPSSTPPPSSSGHIEPPPTIVRDSSPPPTAPLQYPSNCASNLLNSSDTKPPPSPPLRGTSFKGGHHHHRRRRSSLNNMEKIDIIGRINGEFGRWQLRTVLLIFLCKIPSSWFMACIIFTAPAPRHGEFFCRPPAVGNWTDAHRSSVEPGWSEEVKRNKTEWIKIMHPLIEARDNEFKIDFCNVYDDADEHADQYFHNRSHQHPWEKPDQRQGAVIPCDSFLHHSDYRSIITDYDLVCSRDILVATTQFFHLFGVLTGGLLAFFLLKGFSPKSVMLFGMIAQIFCGTLTGQVHTYGLHVFFRCLSAVCCAQMYTAGQMIFSDITSGKPRTIITTCFEQFWSIGVILLPGLSSFFKSWSHIYMAISYPTIILIILWRWIPNSPRWLIAHGRLTEAKAVLIESATYNDKLHLLPADLDHLLQQQAVEVQTAPPPAGWWSLWKGPRAVRHMICVHLAWSIYIVVYYGMLLNIRSFSRDHLEVNTIIAGLCEIAGVFTGLFLILNTTRKWLWTGLFNILAGFIAYSAWTIPTNINPNARVALLMCSAMVSKIAISSTLAMLTTCTTELVCDEKKKICAFSTIVWARIWLLTAPFVGATIIFGQLVPQTAFASLSILGGLLTMALSSARTIPLPDNAGQNLPAELTKSDIWTVRGAGDEKLKA